MAREVVIKIWCDICEDIDGLQIEAKEMPAVQVGGNKPRVLALCEEHEKTFFGPFLEALGLGTTSDLIARTERPKVGRPANRPTESGAIPATKAEGIVCPVPDCGSKSLANTSSLRGHIRTQHETTLDQLLADGVTLYDPQGTALSYTGRGHSTEPPAITRTECDVKGCGTVYEYPESKRPAQALGVHRRMKHGITGAQSKGAK